MECSGVTCKSLAKPHFPFVDILSHSLYTAVAREKRQFRARNLRIEWPSVTMCILRWDQPVNGPPPSYHLVHAAIVISDGTVTSTYRNVQLPGSNTLAQFTSVNRNNLNIFLLNAVYETMLKSSLYFSGKLLHELQCEGVYIL